LLLARIKWESLLHQGDYSPRTDLKQRALWHHK
jgi:hypothetical protein